MQGKPYSDEQLMQALRDRPQIRQRLVELLAVATNEAGDCQLADDAEVRVMQGVRRLGQEALQSWAQAQVEATERDVRSGGRAHREGKKLHWHTTFGDVCVDEPQYRSGSRRIRAVCAKRWSERARVFTLAAAGADGPGGRSAVRQGDGQDGGALRSGAV